MTKVNKTLKIGERIKIKREAERLSAEDLAIKLGLKKENIYKWEKGSTPSDPEQYLKIENWLNNSESIPNSSNIKEINKNPDTLAEALEIIKQQNAFLQRMLESNLTALSRDVNNNSAAIRAEIRGYGKYQILKQSNWDDQEFAKAMAVVDKIYGEELRIDDGQGNPSK